MAAVRARTIQLNSMRRFMVDMLRLAASVPGIPVQRRMRIGRLAAARNQMAERPSWTAIFAKAYGLVALEFPELRRAYVKLPWPHLCEYPASLAIVAFERMFQGEPVVFFTRINKPEARPIQLLSMIIRDRKNSPIEAISDFQWQRTVGGYPGPFRKLILWCSMNMARLRRLRFGTFAITTVGALGAELMHPRGIVSTILSYGPIGDDGNVDVVIVFDHRVMDGATVARALRRLEETLNGAIIADLRSVEGNLAAAE